MVTVMVKFAGGGGGTAGGVGVPVVTTTVPCFAPDGSIWLPSPTPVSSAVTNDGTPFMAILCIFMGIVPVLLTQKVAQYWVPGWAPLSVTFSVFVPPKLIVISVELPVPGISW